MTSRPSRPVVQTLTIVALLATALQAAPAAAEQSPDTEPLLGVHLQPSMSVLLPISSAASVTEVYGLVHPTGAVGLSFHPIERFHILLELEAQGWRGELPRVDSVGEDGPAAAAVELMFLNYWLRLRARVMLLRAGRFQLLADLTTGLVFGREDGERFRAEGEGVSIGVGPVAWLSLGRYIALSLSAIFESGWVWYTIGSAQSRGGEVDEYSLVYPRFLIALGLHGFLVRRSRRPQRSSARATTTAPEPDDDLGEDELLPQQEEMPTPW